MRRRIRIKFTKMSGAGNDFVIVDNRQRILATGVRDFVRVVAERRTGVGADGVLLLEKSRAANFRVRYFNADGSYGGFCGNGGRCIARYAVLNGIAPKRMTFDALGHIYEAEVNGRKVRLRMKDPKDEKLQVELRSGGMRFKLHFVDTGSPHAILFLDENDALLSGELSVLDVMTLGRKLRNHPYFGKRGTNVNFVKLNRDGSLRVRTYERGVEAETFACGTGAVASAIIASRIRGIHSPVTVIPKSQEPLLVKFRTSDDRVGEVYLEGNADVTFSGEVTYDPVVKTVAF